MSDVIPSTEEVIMNKILKQVHPYEIYFSEYERMAKGAEPGAFHYDTPLTREHTLELLKKAGFESVTVEKNYENTALIVAKKKTL